MGINPQGIPFATPNPLERPGPAPDLEDGVTQTRMVTTTDHTMAQDAKLKQLKDSVDHAEGLLHSYLPIEQRCEDELVIANEEAGRRRRAFEARHALASERMPGWNRLAVPIGKATERHGGYAFIAMLLVEGPLAFVAGYALVGGVKTNDALIDGPLKLAPLGFALGAATVCSLATLIAGLLFSEYFEHQRNQAIYARDMAATSGPSSSHHHDKQDES